MKNKESNIIEHGIMVRILSGGKNIQIDMDKKGCENLLEIVNMLLVDPNCSIIEYDKDSGYGYDSGVLSKNSTGIIFSRRDK